MTRIIATVKHALPIAAFLLVFGLHPANAQSLVYSLTEPTIIVPGGPASFLLEVKAIGSPSKVTFESSQQPGTEVMMSDNGTEGDAIAGDGIYTISLLSAPVLAALRPDDVNRFFLGYVRTYSGATSTGRYNMFVDVADASISNVPVVSDAPDVQHTDYVVNIKMAAAFPTVANPTAIPGQAMVTQRFYQLFPDNFDFINVIYMPSFFQNAFHYRVRNAVRGIGASLFDNGNNYGSTRQLVGISVFPIAGFFDGAEVRSQHEMGHQWINSLNVAPLASGIPHWPLSSMASGTMGFSIPPTGQGGDFPCLIVPNGNGIRLTRRTDAPVFNDLDLYLMGLLAADQVSEQIVLDNQDSASVIAQCNGSPYSGTFTRFHVSDLIANPAIGPRIPDSTISQKAFRTAVIIVTRDALLSPDAMSFYSYFAKRAESQTPVAGHSGFLKHTVQPFAVSTRGIGTLNTLVVTKNRLPAVGGVFRSGFWATDSNRNWQWDASDNYFTLGQAGDVSVVGDFDGDTLTEFGIFRNGLWAIDINHDKAWDAGDMYVWLGEATDVPTVGDFDGDGRDDMGVFRSGLWAIDINHSASWDVNDKYVWLGQAGDIPVVGDFNGDGLAEMGVFRNGLWAIDTNRNGLWESSDKYVWLGQAGDIPVVGDFNGDGAAEIGVFRNGLWAIDTNRNDTWDASDGYFWLGQAGDLPVVAR